MPKDKDVKDVKAPKENIDNLTGAGGDGGKKIADDPDPSVGVSVESSFSATPEVIEYRFQRARGVSAYRLLRKRQDEKKWTQIGGVYPDYQFMRLAYEVDRMNEKGHIEWEDHTMKRIIKG
jgi:hypothetical protein